MRITMGNERERERERERGRGERGEGRGEERAIFFSNLCGDTVWVLPHERRHWLQRTLQHILQHGQEKTQRMNIQKGKKITRKA
jgi:hypothetical protein